MRDIIFKSEGISKKYGEHLALDNLNMQVNRGDIYGFIGANGAGKTTTIRLITGLIHQSQGIYQLFGQSSEKAILKSRKKIGCIIEYPALYPNMTAQENLKVQCYQKGITQKGIVEEVLKTVSLSNTGRKKAKDFSLGMRQRLGLAVALLAEPEFLLLDEPTNGLDPMGIIDLRNLLKSLNKEKGITILISSHILTELDKLATTYGIINKGNMIEEISHDEVSKKCSSYLHIHTTNYQKTAVVLENKLQTNNFEVTNKNTIRLRDYTYDVRYVARTLFENGIEIKEISQQFENLESYFKKRIGENQ